MAWSDYITTVKEQIRNKKAKLLIEDELKDHIEEQIKAYQEDGVSYEEAEKMAVLDMGDPIEVGTELNRIHRPKLEKKLLMMVIIFSVFSLILQYFVGRICVGSNNPNYFIDQLGFTIIGIIIMVLIYFFDYTIIGKYPFLIWSIFYLFGIYRVLYGHRYFGKVGGIFTLLYLFIPLFAGVLFRLRNMKIKGLILSGIIGGMPILLAMKGSSFSAMVHYCIILFIIMNIVVGKRWFGIKKRLGYLIVWTGMIGIPLVFFVACYVSGMPLINEYQKIRWQEIFLTLSNNNIFNRSNFARQAMTNTKIIGSNTELLNNNSWIGSDYILVFIFNMFGLIMGLITVGLVLFLLYKAFGIARKQRSVLGYMVGMFCALSFLVQTMFYFISNLGFFQINDVVSQQVLPFLSSGGSNIVYSYGIAGLLLSVYRNSDVVSDRIVLNKASLLGKIRLRS